MKIYPECIPCFFQQALTTLRMATNDEELHLKGLNEIAIRMPELLKLPTPTHAGRVIHNLPKKITNNPDPYREAKIKNTQEALNLYPKLKQMIKNGADPLFAGLKIAVAGNMIDFARGVVITTGGSFDFEEELECIFHKDFVKLDYAEFKIDLTSTDTILYLADNAGETVFDRVFIEELIPLKVIYVVRGVPVLNDATKEDAIMAGIHRVAEIVNSGTDAPGTVLEYCNKEFRELFYKSKLIISKGQGNFEALSDVGADLKSVLIIYFLFKAKCPAVAKHLDVSTGDIIFIKRRP